MAPKSAAKKVVDSTVAVISEPKKSKAKVVSADENEKKAGAAIEAHFAGKASKKENKSRGKKDSAPLVESVVNVENVVVVDSSVDTSIADGFSDFIVKFGGMVSQFGALKAELKQLERKVAKQLKIVEKFQNKKKRKGTRAPSGFVKPSPISDELASFLGKAPGTEMARTDVTREINKYIRGHELQDKTNGRIIKADAALKSLLKLDDADPSVVLTYFNLQKYMSPHFPKQPPTVVA